MKPEAPPAGADSASADALDAVIIACSDALGCKVAVLIARVVDATRAQGLDATGQAIAARIYALVDAGKLEAKGNVRRWRAGEVRRA